MPLGEHRQKLDIFSEIFKNLQEPTDFRDCPANIYLFKVSNRNAGKTYEICSKLTIKTLERRH